MFPNIRRPLRKMVPVLLKAQQDNLNEADTVQRLVMVLADVLGYDRLEEITREAQVRDKYVDLAIKLDGTVKFLVEAKSAGVDLRNRHIDQAKGYAAEANIRWVLLTNGVIWSLYHLTFEQGVEYERLFTVDLSVDELETAAGKLCLLHRRSISRDKHEMYWQQHAALDASSVAKSLYSENVLRLMRRDIRRREGVLVDEEDLAAALHNMFSLEAREKIGPVRIRRRRGAKPSEPAPTATPAVIASTPAAAAPEPSKPAPLPVAAKT